MIDNAKEVMGAMDINSQRETIDLTPRAMGVDVSTRY